LGSESRVRSGEWGVGDREAEDRSQESKARLARKVIIAGINWLVGSYEY
jgi:hypothetical protein